MVMKGKELVHSWFNVGFHGCLWLFNVGLMFVGFDGCFSREKLKKEIIHSNGDGKVEKHRERNTTYHR